MMICSVRWKRLQKYATILPFLFAIGLLIVLSVERIPAGSDMVVSTAGNSLTATNLTNSIKFLKYSFNIVCFSSNRIQIKVQSDLEVLPQHGSVGYFQLAEAYQPRISHFTLNGSPAVFTRQGDLYAFHLPRLSERHPGLKMVLSYEIASKNFTQQVLAELSGSWYPKNIIPERIRTEFQLTVPAGMIGIANGELDTVINTSTSSVYRWKTDGFQTNLGVSIGHYNSFVRLIHSRTYRIYSPVTLEADSRQLSLWASKVGEQYQTWFGGSTYSGLTLVINDTSLEDTSFGSLILLHAGHAQPPQRKFFKLAHEIAHFWWGTVVVPKTPQDWWLVEGFANYSAYLICEAFFQNQPDIPVTNPKTVLSDWQKQYQTFLTDLQTYNVPEMSLAEIGPFDFQRELLYDKGAFVLHMIRYQIGGERFIQYLRQFVTEYQNRQAGIRDFTRLGAAEYGAGMLDFFRQWVYSAGTFNLAVQNFSVSRGTNQYLLRFKLLNKGQLYLPDMVDLEISTATKVYREVLFFQGINVTIQKTLGEKPLAITVNGRYNILEADLSDNVGLFR